MVAFKNPVTSGPFGVDIRLASFSTLAFALLAPPSLAKYTYFSFEYNITDVSPLLKWGITNVHPPWSTSFNNLSTGSAAPFAPWTSPSNYTGPVGWATAVRIHGSRSPDTDGTATEIKYTVDKEVFDYATADSVAPPPNDGTLLSVDAISWKMHTLVMKVVDPARTYAVRGATIRTQLLSNASAWEQVPVSHEEFVMNGAHNPRFTITDSASSRWRPENRRTAVNEGPSVVTELVAGNSSTITIPIPVGTTFVFINGTIGPDRGQALVKWQPLPPHFPTEGWYFNATCGWSAPALLYAKYLDPDEVYNLTIQTLSSELHNVTDIGLHTVTYYSALANETSTSEGATSDTQTATSGRGKVIGGVVGGVLGALALASLLAFFWMRRRRRAKAVSEEQEEWHDSPSFASSMREVDGGSIHSTSSSHRRALPPSYNPQWNRPDRVVPPVSPVSPVTLSSGDPYSALSPGANGSSAGFPKSPHTQNTPSKGLTSNAMMPFADYKQPYILGTYQLRDAPQPDEAGALSEPPRPPPLPPGQEGASPVPTREARVPPPLPSRRSKRPLPALPSAPEG